jgi:glycosyl transferase family 25
MEQRPQEWQAFVINLDKDVERLGHARAQAAAVGLRFERFPAVHGTHVPTELRDEFFDEHGCIRQPLLAPGEVGCYASHLLAARQLLERHLEMALILEDENSFDPCIISVINAITACPAVQWDMVYLAARPRRAMVVAQRLPDERYLVRYSQVPFACSAYLLSAKGARKFVAPRPRMRSIELELKHPWRINLDVYGVFPPIVVSTPFESSIEGMAGNKRDHDSGWWRPTFAEQLSGFRWHLQTLGPVGFLRCKIEALSHSVGKRLISDGQNRGARLFF